MHLVVMQSSRDLALLEVHTADNSFAGRMIWPSGIRTTESLDVLRSTLESERNQPVGHNKVRVGDIKIASTRQPNHDRQCRAQVRDCFRQRAPVGVAAQATDAMHTYAIHDFFFRQAAEPHGHQLHLVPLPNQLLRKPCRYF